MWYDAAQLGNNSTFSTLINTCSIKGATYHLALDVLICELQPILKGQHYAIKDTVGVSRLDSNYVGKL